MKPLFGGLVALLLLLIAACGDDTSGSTFDSGLPDAGGIDAAISCSMDKECDDFNPCTIDRCNEEVCSFVNGREGEACSDGLACTTGDHCESGACVTAPTDCGYLNDFCTVGTCDETEGGCVATPIADSTSCDDGQFCTVNDTCTGGVCAGSPRDCSAEGDACNVASCDEASSSCVLTPNADGAPCDDGLTCTDGDTCSSGTCVGGALFTCDDANSCTSDSCNVNLDVCENSSVPPIAGGEGSPGDASCANGVDDDCDGLIDLNDPDCSACVSAADCDDGNDCTADSCSPGGCVNSALTGNACDDGLFCTDGDMCNAGLCEAGPPRNCSDGNACSVDQCSEDTASCSNLPLSPTPSSLVTTSAGADVCLVAGSSARSVVWTELRDANGSAVLGASVSIGGMQATESPNQPGTYWIELTAAAAPGSESLTVVASACGGPATTLSTTIPVAYALPNASAGGTGGCSPTGGNVRVRVLAAESGLPLVGARILIGDAQGTPFDRNPEALFGGGSLATSNIATTDSDGQAEFRDYGSALSGPIVVTAGDDTRAYVTIASASASDLVLSLPLLHPPAPETTTYELGTSMASVANCNDLDLALVLPTLDLDFFSNLNLDRFFGRSKCWDSMNDVTETMAVSENFWIPSQTIGPFCAVGEVAEGTWSLPLRNTATTGVNENVTLLHVRVPLGDITAVTSGGAPLASLLESTTYRGLGFMLDETVPSAPTQGRAIPVVEDYPNQFSVTYSGKPSDTDIIGFVVGDYEGTSGTGALTLIGHKVHPWDLAGSTVTVPNSDLNASGSPAGIRRLGSVSALYLNPDDHTTNPIPSTRAEAVSTVLVRGVGSAPFGAAGGNATVSDFLDLAGTVASPKGQLRWQNTTNNGHAPVYSRHDLVVRRDSYFPPLTCSTDNDKDSADSVQWVIYRPFDVACGGDECVSLPALPPSFPRAQTTPTKRSGFEALDATGSLCTADDCTSGSACVDPDDAGPAEKMCMSGAGTAVDPYVTEAYRWRLHVYDLGLDGTFAFDNFDFASHPSFVTHESSNEAALP